MKTPLPIPDPPDALLLNGPFHGRQMAMRCVDSMVVLVSRVDDNTVNVVYTLDRSCWPISQYRYHSTTEFRKDW